MMAAKSLARRIAERVTKADPRTDDRLLRRRWMKRWETMVNEELNSGCVVLADDLVNNPTAGGSGKCCKLGVMVRLAQTICRQRLVLRQKAIRLFGSSFSKIAALDSRSNVVSKASLIVDSGAIKQGRSGREPASAGYQTSVGLR